MAPAARFASQTCAAVLAGTVASLTVYALAGRVSAFGIGTSVVSPATVSTVHYRLNSVMPSHIDALALALRPAIRGGEVAVRAGKATYHCRLSHAGTHALCATTSPQLVVSDLTALSVIAAQ